MRQIHIYRGSPLNQVPGGYYPTLSSRWYWKVKNDDGSVVLADSPGSYGTAVQAIQSVESLFLFSDEKFRWMIGGRSLPKDGESSVIFASTVKRARTVYMEVINQ